MPTSCELKQKARKTAAKQAAKAKAEPKANAKAKAQKKQAGSKGKGNQSTEYHRRESVEDKSLRYLTDCLSDLDADEKFDKLAGNPLMTCYDRVVEWKRERGDDRNITPAQGTELRALYKKQLSPAIFKPKVAGEHQSKDLKEAVVNSMVSSAFEVDRKDLVHTLELRSAPLNETENMLVLRSLHGRNLTKLSEAQHVFEVMKCLIATRNQVAFSELYAAHKRMVDEASLKCLEAAMANGGETGSEFVARSATALNLVTDTAKLLECLKVQKLSDRYDDILVLMQESRVAKRLFRDDARQLISDRAAMSIDAELKKLDAINAPTSAQCKKTLDVLSNLVADAEIKLREFSQRPYVNSLFVGDVEITMKVKNLKLHRAYAWGAVVRSRAEGFAEADGGIDYLLPQVWCGALPKIISTKKPFPTEFSSKIQQGRMKINEFISDGYLTSGNHIRKKITRKADYLQTRCSDVGVDHALLTALHSKTGIEHYKNVHLQAMGNEKEPHTLSEALDMFETLKDSSVAKFIDGAEKGKIDAAAGIVKHIYNGILSKAEYGALTGFKKDLADIAHKCICVTQHEEGGEIVTTWGKAAIPILLEIVKKGEGDTSDEKNILAQFYWLLDDSQTKKADLGFQKLADGTIKHSIATYTPKKKSSPVEAASEAKKKQKTEKEAVTLEIDNWFK